MKKIIFIGRSESGKTTLTQRLKNQPVGYSKTQYVDYGEAIIDTPGEYIQERHLGAALAVYSYEADVVGLLLSATEPYSLFSPNITSMANREVVGIITKIDEPDANAARAESWLRLAGCKRIFKISSKTCEGIEELAQFLKE